MDSLDKSWTRARRNNKRNQDQVTIIHQLKFSAVKGAGGGGAGRVGGAGGVQQELLQAQLLQRTQ